MKKAAVFALAGLAGIASAQLHIDQSQIRDINYSLSYEAVDNDTVSPEFTGLSYDALAFVAPVSENNFNPGNQVQEDYVSIQSDADYLNILRFVGGVSTVGDTLVFGFFNAGGNLVDAFSVSFGSAGLTFVWTITINSDIFVPKEGFLVIQSAATNTGPANWRSREAAPAIGTTTGAAFRWNMEVSDVPTPASLALLGLGGLAAGRRRR